MDVQTNTDRNWSDQRKWPTLAHFPVAAKALVTAIIAVMGIALLGALGQIIVHDIIPTFFAEKMSAAHTENEGHANDQLKESSSEGLLSERGDLFSDLSLEDKELEVQPFYKNEQFIWLLKWTHIHLFGMNIIFIFMGAIAVFLNVGKRIRTWLVVLPFIGVLIDIAAMWLKTYVSQIFFWLHIPGGGLFLSVFMFISIRALMEMWYSSSVR